MMKLTQVLSAGLPAAIMFAAAAVAFAGRGFP
jgi:hypothetical protein